MAQSKYFLAKLLYLCITNYKKTSKFKIGAQKIIMLVYLLSPKRCLRIGGKCLKNKRNSNLTYSETLLTVRRQNYHGINQIGTAIVYLFPLPLLDTYFLKLKKGFFILSSLFLTLSLSMYISFIIAIYLSFPILSIFLFKSFCLTGQRESTRKSS
jgi:hypothetical protein